MSTKTITVEMYQCDYVHPDGTRCESEGERQGIKRCALCNKDLCSRHYEQVSVSSRGGRETLIYHFCEEHTHEFMDTLINTFGDTRPVAYAGMAK